MRAWARPLLAIVALGACQGTEGELFHRRGAAADAGSWPDEGSTGVPPGSALRALVGDQDLATAGQVLEDAQIDGCVRILADHVTLRRVRIRCGFADGVALDAGQHLGTLLEEVEVDGLGSAGSLVEGSFIAHRLNLHHGCQIARLYSNTVLERSFLHDVAGQAPCHGVKTLGGDQIRLTGNRLDPGENGSYALALDSEVSALTNVLVEGNLIGGGNYSIYAGPSKNPYPQSNVVLRANRFLRSSTYGPLVLDGPGVTLEGNVWDDTGEPIP